MSRKTLGPVSSATDITADGQYRLPFLGSGRRSFTTEWNAPGIAPAGMIVLSFDGNYGTAPGVMDLSTASNAIAASQPLRFIDIDVSGLPTGGAFTLYCFT